MYLLIIIAMSGKPSIYAAEVYKSKKACVERQIYDSKIVKAFCVKLESMKDKPK